MSTQPTAAPRALRLRESQLFLALTILVGVLAGLSAVLFAIAIEWCARLLFGLDPSHARLLLVPGLVSIGTGILLWRFFPEARGSGVPQTKAAYHLRNGAIDARTTVGKFVTGVACIASGHSMGREGPSVQIGAGLASMVGRSLRLSPARTRDLVAVGSAGALAAAFNTPVAAVLFTLEEIIGDMNAPLLGSTVVASVASVVVERSILGNEPLFRVPTYHLQHPAELLAYVALGVLGGVLSLAFSRSLLRLRGSILSWPLSTRPWQPALGGLVIGAVLLGVPQVMGVGYEYVDQALNGGLLLETMALLCLVKLGATVVSYATGNAGGIFAPTLYIGAMAGGALGMVVHAVAPFPTAEPGAYALVGMGALFAGIIRAPMTSVFMIFEITQDYQILVPLMVANLLSFVISRRWQPVPVYHALLEQDHVHVRTGAPAPPVRTTAADLMRREFPVLHPDERLADVSSRLREHELPAWIVANGDGALGVVTRAGVDAAMEKTGEDASSGDRIGDVLAPLAIHVHPDHPIDVVLERYRESGGLLPVVSREDVRRVVGVIGLADITRFASRRADAARSGEPAPPSDTPQAPTA